MRRSLTAATAVLLLAPVVPASAVPDVPDREVFADRYMSILCPLNVKYDQMNRRLNKWDGDGSFDTGDPVPRFARAAFRDMARAYSEAASQMDDVAWPDPIRQPAERITRRFESGVDYYGSRDTRRIKPSWRNKMYSAGSAPRYMRKALDLPPVGQGCGTYD